MIANSDEKTSGSASLAEGLTFIEQLQNCSAERCTKDNRPYLMGVNEEHRVAMLTRPNCKQWDCPSCSAKLARVWIAKIINGCNRLGGEWYFLTLTVGSKARREKSTAVLRDGWDRVYACINALFSRDGNTPHYAKVWEQQGDGTFHIHALMDVIMSKRWIKDTAVAAGLGHQADWRKVDNSGQVAGYIAKYTLKNASLERGGVAWPKGLRRIETSRNWPKLAQKDVNTQWDWVLKWTRMEQVLAAQKYHLKGYDILDQVKDEPIE